MARRCALGAALLLALVLAEHLVRVDGIVEGDHFFRQAHVLSNVDGMLLNGIVSVPTAWNDNQALHFFDLPVYQALVTLVAHATGAAPGWLAEFLSLLLGAATALAGASVMRRLRVPPWGVLAGVLAIAASPIGRFWSCAALPDNLAVCLAAWSVVALLARSAATSPRQRAVHTTLWLVATFVATAIKPPVFLPVALTTMLSLWQSRAGNAKRFGALLVFVATTLAGVALLRVVSTIANANALGWPDLATELAWYFGSVDERLSLATHSRMLGRIVKEVVTLPGFLLAAAFWLQPTTSLRPAHRLLTGWSLLAIGSSLLFLHVNLVHNYYQLPCVLPLALSAGCGALQIVQAVASRTAPRVAAITAILLLTAVAVTSQRYFDRIAAPTTQRLRAIGAFVAEHTAPDDFVLYGTATDDDNPAFLYFAQRHGHNTIASALANEAKSRRASAAQRLVAYAPPGEVATALAAQPGWIVLASNELGAVLRVP